MPEAAVPVALMVRCVTRSRARAILDV